MYTIISKENYKLIKIFSKRYGIQNWKYGKIKAEHGSYYCSICGQPVNIVGYYAATRGSNRDDRICTRCVYSWIPERKIG